MALAKLGAQLWPRASHGALRHFGAELRKPWVILNDARSRLESSLRLDYDQLLLFLSQQLAATVGLAHVSGNVYLGPALDDLKMSGEQVLVANLFSHGEIGVDAIASAQLPDADTLPVLQCLATYPKLRWLRSDAVVAPEAADSEAKRPAWAEVVKPVKRSVLKKHPLLSQLVDPLREGDEGSCLQHANFIHHDIVGESLEECQSSAAQIASKRAYSSVQPRGGCALLTSKGLILSGSQIGARGGVSPLQCALVSLAANGLEASEVMSVAYVGAVAEDQQLMEEVIPQATLRRVELE